MGCTYSASKNNDEFIEPDVENLQVKRYNEKSKKSSMKKHKQSKYKDKSNPISPKTTTNQENSQTIKLNEVSSPKSNASINIVAWSPSSNNNNNMKVTNFQDLPNINEFDMEFLEKKCLCQNCENYKPLNPNARIILLPMNQGQIFNSSLSTSSNRIAQSKISSVQTRCILNDIPEHSSLTHEYLPSTSGSSSSSSPGFIPSVSQSHELAGEPLRLMVDYENEDLLEESYIRSAVEWRNQHKGKVNLEVQLKKRRVEMICTGAFIQFNDKSLKYEILCVDSALPGLRMPVSESEKTPDVTITQNKDVTPPIEPSPNKELNSVPSSSTLTISSTEDNKISCVNPLEMEKPQAKSLEETKTSSNSSPPTSESSKGSMKGRIIRPDLIVRDLSTGIIVHVEIDEHKHRNYDKANEEIRAKTIADYFSSKGMKYKRLNFNPNGYENRLEMAQRFVDFINCYKGICGVFSVNC